MVNSIKSVIRRLLPNRFLVALSALRHPDAFVLKKDYVLNNKSKVTYNNDGLTTIHNCDFMFDEWFSQAYKKGKETGSWGRADIYWRTHVACFVAQIGKNLEGDFVECGVNKGGLSRNSNRICIV